MRKIEKQERDREIQRGREIERATQREREGKRHREGDREIKDKKETFGKHDAKIFTTSKTSTRQRERRIFFTQNVT